MSYVDIAIIALVILMALIGLWKGAGKELIALVCFVLSLGACYLVADYCLKFILEVEVIRNLALGETFSLRALIGNEIASAPDSSVVQALYAPLIARYASFSEVWAVSEAEFLSVVVSLHLFTIVLSVLLYIAARIIASIVGYILKIIFIHGEVTLVGRIFGLVVGAIKGAAVVCALMFIVSAVFPFGFSKIVTDEMDKSAIAPPVCKAVYEITGSHLYSDDTIELMLKGAGFSKLPDADPGEGSGDGVVTE